MNLARFTLALVLSAALLLAAPSAVLADTSSGITITASGIVSLMAETSIILEKDSDNVIVATVYIDRIYDPNTGLDAVIPGGVGAYEAVVTANPAGIEILSVRGVSPFDSPSFDSGTGIFAVSGVASPAQPANTPVAKIVLRLVGNAVTPYDLTVEFQLIESADSPGMNVPEESSNSLTFRRGDAKEDGVVNIVDAMFLAQYTVGLRALSELNISNAASVRQDGTGDTINIVDAMFIAQYTVGLRDNEFN